MAIIKECDRCGYQQIKESDYKKVFPIQVYGSHHDDAINIVKDLCTKCKDELIKFMNEKLPKCVSK